MGLSDKMFNPMNQRRAIIVGAGIRHLPNRVKLHLALVIERRADLHFNGFFSPNSAGEVI